jgi:multiple sugar transport system permease protein
MVAPTIIGLLVLNILPFIQAIYMSFSKSLPFGMFEFEGIDNYVEMFQNAEFCKATGNPSWFCILTVPVGIFTGAAGSCAAEQQIRGRTTFRAIFYPAHGRGPRRCRHGLEVDFLTPSMVLSIRCWVPTSVG